MPMVTLYMAQISQAPPTRCESSSTSSTHAIHPLRATIHPSSREPRQPVYCLIPNTPPITDALPPSISQRVGCHLATRADQLREAEHPGESHLVDQGTPDPRVPNTTDGCLHPCARAPAQEWRQRDASSPWSSHRLTAL